MNKDIFNIYKCYLGDHLLYRTAVIYDFVMEYGTSFFDSYSTSADTIANFIQKCKDQGLIRFK